jgi:acyl-CoA dehydrogenase
MKRLWTVPLLIAGSLVLLMLGLRFLSLLVLTLVALCLLLPHWRQSILTGPLAELFHQALPPLSATEREALASGSVWWDAELFTGKPDWQQLLNTPASELTTKEQAFLDGPVQQLCEQLNDWQINHKDHDLSPALWSFIKKEGFFGLIVPEEYGGKGFSPKAHSDIILKIASRSVTAAVTVMVPNSLGPAELLLHYGTRQQKDYYLPRLASGTEVPCFALTGPEAGSDASHIPDRGVVCRRNFEGKDTLGIEINWEKRYITLGPVATLLGLAFHLYDPEHLLGDTTDIGITLALIPTDTEGVSIGRRHWPMGTAFQNGPNWGKDVFIPMDWVIGGQDYVGRGWQMLMESLAAGRSISLPALSTGAAKFACRISGAYARVREQFHQPIGRFEGIADLLGRMAGQSYMVDAVRRTTADAVGRGERPAVLSAIAKYHLTETMRRIVNDAMDIHGGKTICLGPHNPLANVYQTIPISITVEGANILTRNLIIFGQGAFRAHPFILKEMAALEVETVDQRTSAFDEVLCQHIGHFSRNLGRSFLFGLTLGRFSQAPAGEFQRHYQRLNHLSASLAVATDVCLVLFGGSLKRRESLSARLGDVLSQLYIASCTLQRYHHSPSEHDTALADWATTQAIYQAELALTSLCDNLPNRLIGWLLKRLTIPLGPRYRAPTDKLTHLLSEQLQQPGDMRDQLTAGIFMAEKSDQYVAQLEQAFTLCVTATPLERTLHKSGLTLEQAQQQGVLSDEDIKRIRSARQARRQIIEVDHFNAKLEDEE